METIQYTYVDRSRWPEQRGPWENEPDKIQYQDEETGLPCLIVRGPSGALCGYVGVPPEHPAYESDYDEVNADVHGGLTFANHCHEREDNTGICHIPEPGEPDKVWWLGFDCAHAGDKCPAYESIFQDGCYRPVSYVDGEIRHLAAQLAAMN